MRCAYRSVTFLAVAVFTPIAPGSPFPMYVVDSANHLLTVDVQSGQVDRVDGGFAQLTDIAFDPQGTLYGITAVYVYEIDVQRGWSTLIGAHGFGNPTNPSGIDALTFGADGVLYGAGNDILISIDPDTGAGTALGNLSGYSSSGDLAVDSAGRLLLTTDAGALVEVHPDGSGATRIGSLPYDDIYALASNGDGDIYGIRSTNELVSVDPVTGNASIITELQADFLIGRAWGASFPDQFIPEPATLVLLLTGLGVIGSRRRSKALGRKVQGLKVECPDF